MLRLDVVLRTHQHTWLRGVADRQDTSISRVFGTLIESRPAPMRSRSPPKESRAHVVILPHHLAMLDRLAIEAGVNRSEMARRLIDEALTQDWEVGR